MSPHKPMPQAGIPALQDREDVKQSFCDPQPTELHELLSAQYVHDLRGNFRLVYSPEALRWRLSPPGWRVGLRQEDRLVGAITAVPLTSRVHGSVLPMVYVDFLCVHRELRGQGLAVALIEELTRRVRLCGREQALFLSAVPRGGLASVPIFQRPLDGARLAEVGFLEGSAPRQAERQWRLSEAAGTPMRAMTPEDVPAVCALLAHTGRDQSLVSQLSEEEVAHWLLPREGVVQTLVSSDQKNVSSYTTVTLASVGDPWSRAVTLARSAVLVATSAPVGLVLQSTLQHARQQGAHLFERADMGGHSDALRALRFSASGELHLELFGWPSAPLEPDQIGFLLPL
jgi:glycylpeptide N-tetradecanoyltransferase